MCCPQEVTGEPAEPMSRSQVCLVRIESSSFVPGMCMVAFPLPFFPHPVLWAGSGPGGQATASLECALHLQ